MAFNTLFFESKTFPMKIFSNYLVLSKFNSTLIFILSNSVMHALFFQRSLWEMNDFRQAQTAWAIRSFVENGINFDTPLPIFGPNTTLPLEMPIYQAISALLSQVLNLDVIFVSRLLSFSCFLITGLLFANFLKIYFSDPRVKDVFLVLYSISPFGFQWAHSVSIEFLATAFGSLALLGLLKFIHSTPKHNTNAILFYSTISLTLAYLTKVTTGVAFSSFYLLMVFLIFNKELNFWQRLFLNLPHFVAFISFFFWNEFANSKKRDQYFASHLTSENMWSWNIGSFEQRFDVATWYKILILQWSPILGSFLSVIVVVLWMSRRKTVSSKTIRVYVKFVWILLTSALIPILVFTNLYYIHDYYSVAIYIFLIGVLSILVSLSIEYFFKSKAQNVPLSLLALILAFGLVSTTYGERYFFNNYYYLIGKQDNKPSWFDEVNESVQGEPAMYVNCNWNPIYPFYLKGQAYMLPPLLPPPSISYMRNARFVIDCRADLNPYTYDWRETITNANAKIIKINENLYRIVWRR